MAVKLEASNQGYFKINDVPYQKGVVRPVYDGNNVGLRVTETNEELVRPTIFSDWTNEADTPYSSLANLQSAIESAVFYEAPSGGGGGAPTNLGIGTRTTTTLQVTSSTGANVDIPLASPTLAGITSAADKVTINSVLDIDVVSVAQNTPGTLTFTRRNGNTFDIVIGGSGGGATEGVITISFASDNRNYFRSRANNFELITTLPIPNDIIELTGGRTNIWADDNNIGAFVGFQDAISGTSYGTTTFTSPLNQNDDNVGDLTAFSNIPAATTQNINMRVLLARSGGGGMDEVRIGSISLNFNFR